MNNTTIKKTLLTIWLFCLLPFSTTACWNSVELNEISVVLAMGIDTKKDQYEVTVQLVDPSQMSRNRLADRSPAITFSEQAPTIFEAVRKLTIKTSRKLYFAHIRLLVFDETTARNGIKDAVDLLFRDHEVRPDFYLAVAKKVTARDILAFVTPTEVLPAMDYDKSLKISEKAWAPTAAVNVVELLQSLMKDGKELVLTGLTLTGNIAEGKTTANIKDPLAHAEYNYSELGVFRDEKLIGWLNSNDSKVYNYITNNVNSTVASAKCPASDKRFVVEVQESQTKIIPSFSNNHPSVTVAINVTGVADEFQCNMDLKQSSAIAQLEQVAHDAFKQLLESGTATVQQQLRSDIFGFGEAFHRRYPKEWHEMKNNWDKIFPTIPVQFNIHYHLKETGKILNPMDRKRMRQNSAL